MAATELILSGNGPGELTGWIAPVARAARRLAHDRNLPLRLTLALSPSQFAGGRELEVVRSWGLFDEIIPPGTVMRLAIGTVRPEPPKRGILLHLGGDLWVSGRMAARFGVPAAALAETTLVARRHLPFRRIFAVSSRLADRLAARGVPAAKISVSGDPRSDVVLDGAGQGARPETGGGYVVSFLPGSRDRFFALMAPYFLEAADVLTRRGLDVTAQIIVSDFLSPDLVAASRSGAGARARWITGDPWPALRRSDLAVTIPGTNTLELGMLGVPFAVVLEESRLHAAPLEGPAEWLTRVPVLGRPVRRMLVRSALRRLRFIALPNALAGRLVVPEWIGRCPATDLANRVAELLGAPERIGAIRAGLLELGLRTPGAAERVAAGTLAMIEETNRKT